jgi:hypothetical protein
MCMRINEITMGYHPSTLAYPYKVKTDKDGNVKLIHTKKKALRKDYPFGSASIYK